mgnify:CR=1 FL=1
MPQKKRCAHFVLQRLNLPGPIHTLLAGNRNEVFTGGYWADPDEPPITWTEGEMGRALFYYDGVVNQRFLTVHS